MSQSYTIGHVTADFELQSSVKDIPYVRFSLAENLGYGEHARTQYLQVWAWREDATRLIKRKVKKGSLIWVSGSLELETYQKRDAKTNDKRLKVTLDNWGFVLGGKASTSPPAEATHVSNAHDDAAQALPDSEIDGDREPLPD